MLRSQRVRHDGVAELSWICVCVHGHVWRTLQVVETILQYYKKLLGSGCDLSSEPCGLCRLKSHDIFRPMICEHEPLPGRCVRTRTVVQSSPFFTLPGDQQLPDLVPVLQAGPCSEDIVKNATGDHNICCKQLTFEGFVFTFPLCHLAYPDGLMCLIFMLGVSSKPTGNQVIFFTPSWGICLKPIYC